MKPLLGQGKEVLKSKLHRPKWHFGRGSVQIYVGDRKKRPGADWKPRTKLAEGGWSSVRCR